MDTNVEMQLKSDPELKVNPRPDNRNGSQGSLGQTIEVKADFKAPEIRNQEDPHYEPKLTHHSERSALKVRTNEQSPSGNDMEIVWRDINIIAQLPGKEKKTKNILTNVNGRVKSGECLAIIGSSGAGKTTLLNYLSRKIESKTLGITGEVLLNGENIDNDKFNLISSYVMQDDILEASMTPLEILLFTAKLKLRLPHHEIEKRVKKMIEDLHLTKCQNTRIGSVLQRGVSGGERKRTSIGVELISDPKIVFLDEPTTGLDSFNAYEVIQLLNDLSKMNKVIVFTIHQPSSEIFDLLDKLCIMALGKTVFFGPKDLSLDCFASYNLAIPANYNPFEHFMEMTNISVVQNKEVLAKYPELESMENPQDRHESLMTTLNVQFEKDIQNYIDITPTINGLSEENLQLIKDKDIRNSFFYEWAMIFSRNIIVAKRNPKLLFIKVMQSVFTAILLAILFTNVSKDYSGIQDRLGILLNCMINTILAAATASILVCKYFIFK